MVKTILILCAATLMLGGCIGSQSASELKESLGSGFVRSNDTYGTSRRPDVYGEFTKPSLPTMGASGYGK